MRGPHRNIAGILYEIVTFSSECFVNYSLCLCRCQNYVFCYNLPSKMLQYSFWRSWGLLGRLGGSLGSLLFTAGLGTFFFHRFGRCPNHDDFLEQFISQSAPKLVLVTLAPLGPPWGDLLYPLGAAYNFVYFSPGESSIE